MHKRILRLVILAMIGFALGGALAYLEVQRSGSGNHDATTHSTHAAEQRAMATGTPLGGRFELLNSEGQLVKESEYDGSYRLVFFGFTHCPDVCPAALEKISIVMSHLGDKADNIVPIFITVDPARDTPEIMGEYTDLFDDRIVGLTGSQEQIDHAIDQYKVYAARDDRALASTTADHHHEHHDHHGGHDDNMDHMDHMGDDAMSAEEHAYLMQHSAYIYVMGPDNKLITVMRSEDTVDEMRATLEGIL